MARELLSRINGYFRRRLGLPSRLIHVRILERDFVVQDGTMRPQADYDDAWFLACALHSESVFDVGAHTGDSALLAFLSPTVKKVVLIEANAAALAVAADNLIRNRMSANAHFIPAFAGEVDNSTINFWTVGTGAAGSMYRSHAVSAAKTNSFIEVPTVTVDSLCNLYSVVPDLVKIDVEGAEHEVLLGGRECAQHGKTRFLVEMHSNPEVPMARNAALVLDWCRSMGYAAWYLKEASRCETPEQIAHRGRCHLLMQPASWDYPDWLRGIRQGAELATAWNSRRYTP